MSSVRRGKEKRGTAKRPPPVASRADGVQCSLGQPCCTATSSIIEKSWQHEGTTWDCLSSQEPQELLRARAVWLGYTELKTSFEDGWLPAIRCCTSFTCI